MKYKLKVFSTEWCGECRLTKKILDDNGVEYEVVDLDKNPTASEEYNINEMPVIIAFNGDKEESRWTVTQGGIMSWVKFLDL